MLFKSTLLLFLLCPLLVLASKGDEEHKLRITKTFGVSGSSKVMVSNKYGKITVNIWNRQECKADIEITGFGNNADQARRMAEMVEIKANSNGSDVKMETAYNANSGAGKWFNFGKKDSRDYVKVNYNLFVPANIAYLMLDNNFGDVLARELPMAAVVQVNYGFVDIAEAGKKLSVRINYTDKCRIGKAKDLDISANYSSIKVGNAGNVDIRSNNGDHSFGSVGDVKMHSNYDDIKFQRVKSLSLDANYTDFKSEQLDGALTLSANYGDIVLRHVSNDFKNMQLNLNYTDVVLGISDRAAFRLHASMKNGDLKTKDFEWKNVNQVRKNENLSFSAITANGSDASPAISINARYSDVKLGGD
ncbi:hypothetical protein ACFOTA_04540 [Chitinophaga sp. GCM10012297]|uniref:Adhesin domain-containing protein n=1 Tax=Chitinophaga chungangae TaxID=2821488 RepID=A0ABS3YAV3_9BACT|nr:hypothetical protein [Chitinophaga chungangae]MBO9151463.1 hypothetical protein [Chitinophaga chungangae]